MSPSMSSTRRASHAATLPPSRNPSITSHPATSRFAPRMSASAPDRQPRCSSPRPETDSSSDQSIASRPATAFTATRPSGLIPVDSSTMARPLTSNAATLPPTKAPERWFKMTFLPATTFVATRGHRTKLGDRFRRRRCFQQHPPSRPASSQSEPLLSVSEPDGLFKRVRQLTTHAAKRCPGRNTVQVV